MGAGILNFTKADAKLIHWIKGVELFFWKGAWGSPDPARVPFSAGTCIFLQNNACPRRKMPFPVGKCRDRKKNHDSHRRDRILRFFSPPGNRAIFSTFGAASLPNCTVNLEKSERNPLEKNIFKKIQWRRRPEISDDSVPCRGRTRPEDDLSCRRMQFFEGHAAGNWRVLGPPDMGSRIKSDSVPSQDKSFEFATVEVGFEFQSLVLLFKAPPEKGAFAEGSVAQTCRKLRAKSAPKLKNFVSCIRGRVIKIVEFWQSISDNFM